MNGWCVVDLDRTLVADRTVERLARRLGLEEPIAAAFGSGEPNAGLDEAQRIMRCMAGVPWREFHGICCDLRLRDGAAEALDALRRGGMRIAVATASYLPAARHAARLVGAEACAALEPEVVDGRLTGRILPTTWAGDCGLAVCKGRFIASLERPVVAIGDGRNDVCMLREADLGIAIAPCHPDARAAADAVVEHWAEIPPIVARRLEARGTGETQQPRSPLATAERGLPVGAAP